MKDFWIYPALIVLVVLIFGGLIAIGENSNRDACAQTGQMLKMEWRYGGLWDSTCRVNTPDLGWWNADDYIKILAIRHIKED